MYLTNEVQITPEVVPPPYKGDPWLLSKHVCNYLLYSESLSPFKRMKSIIQPHFTCTGCICCPNCLYILLMWSAIVLVDIHLSTSRSQNGLRSSIAVFHMSGSRSPGFFLKSMVSGCGGRCICSLFANSNKSAGLMKLELSKTTQGNHEIIFNGETLLCTGYHWWHLQMKDT